MIKITGYARITLTLGKEEHFKLCYETLADIREIDCTYVHGLMPDRPYGFADYYDVEFPSQVDYTTWCNSLSIMNHGPHVNRIESWHYLPAYPLLRTFDHDVVFNKKLSNQIFSDLRAMQRDGVIKKSSMHSNYQWNAWFQDMLKVFEMGSDKGVVIIERSEKEADTVPRARKIWKKKIKNEGIQA